MFAWALDGILRWVSARSPPCARFSAFADDIAALLKADHAGVNFLQTFECILLKVCGLSWNHKKIVCVSALVSVYAWSLC